MKDGESTLCFMKHGELQPQFQCNQHLSSLSTEYSVCIAVFLNAYKLKAFCFMLYVKTLMQYAHKCAVLAAKYRIPSVQITSSSLHYHDMHHIYRH